MKSCSSCVYMATATGRKAGSWGSCSRSEVKRRLEKDTAGSEATAGPCFRVQDWTRVGLFGVGEKRTVQQMSNYFETSCSGRGSCTPAPNWSSRQLALGEPPPPRLRVTSGGGGHIGSAPHCPYRPSPKLHSSTQAPPLLGRGGCLRVGRLSDLGFCLLVSMCPLLSQLERQPTPQPSQVPTPWRSGHSLHLEIHVSWHEDSPAGLGPRDSASHRGSPGSPEGAAGEEGLSECYL